VRFYIANARTDNPIRIEISPIQIIGVLGAGTMGNGMAVQVDATIGPVGW